MAVLCVGLWHRVELNGELYRTVRASDAH